MKRLTAIAVAVLAGMWSNAAVADGPAWGKVCPKDGNCFVEQVAMTMPQKAVVLRVRFDLKGDKGQARMAVTAPLGVVLPAGLQLAVDSGKAIPLPYDRCFQDGCTASAVLDKIALAQFEKGTILNVRFATDKNPVDIPMHLDGLLAALNDLAKSSN